MEEQIAWAVGKPSAEDWQLSETADTQAYYGHLRKARELTQQAIESAKRNDAAAAAARWQISQALWESEFGNRTMARKAANDALALSSQSDVEVLAALTYARIADDRQAARLADKIATDFERDTIIQNYWLPAIRASIEINQGHAQKAIELLRAASDYEFASP